MNGSSSTEPSLGVMWKNNLLPGNSKANFLTNSHQTLKTCCMQVNRMQINSKTATVGKTLKLPRDGEEEHRHAHMQLNEQQDTAERRSRQRNPSRESLTRRQEVVFQERIPLAAMCSAKTRIVCRIKLHRSLCCAYLAQTRLSTLGDRVALKYL